MSDTERQRLLAVLGETEPAILEGRVVDEVPRSVPLRAVHAVRVVAKHDRTRAAGRNVAYVGVGAAVIVRRLWESRSTARYERYIRAAEAAGDHESALAVGRAAGQVPEGPAPAPDVADRAAAEGRAGTAEDRRRGSSRCSSSSACCWPSRAGTSRRWPPRCRTVAQIAEWVAIAFSVAWGPFLLGAAVDRARPSCTGWAAGTRTPR